MTSSGSDSHWRPVRERPWSRSHAILNSDATWVTGSPVRAGKSCASSGVTAATCSSPRGSNHAMTGERV